MYAHFYLTRMHRAKHNQVGQFQIRESNIEDSFKPNRVVLESAKFKFCSELTWQNILSCADTLGDFESLLRIGTAGNSQVNGVPIYKKVLTDTSYVDGARRAALKVLTRVSEKPPSSNYLRDMVEAFKEAEFDSNTSQDKGWDLIGLISTGGANIGSRLLELRLPAEMEPLRLAITVTADTILETLMMEVSQRKWK